MKKTEKALVSFAEALSNPAPDPYGWPPVCGGFFYQPERPVCEKKENSIVNTATIKSKSSK